jgi:hypothetical protein
MDILDISAIPVITVICFLAAEVAKLTPMKDECIPALCGVCCAMLGVVALYAAPGLIPATDIHGRYGKVLETERSCKK